MAAKRQRWGSEGGTRKRKKRMVSSTVFDTITPYSSLERLPDNVTLAIMFHLDVLSIIHLSQVSKRFYHLSQDESIWINVDMSTLPQMDIRKIKKFIDQKLPPDLHVVQIQSSYELRGRASHKPKIDSSVLNALIEKCPNIRKIKLMNCDLSFLTSSSECKLLVYQPLEDISLVHCNTLIHWMEHADWPNLKHLDFDHTVKTSEFEIKAIVQKERWHSSLKSLTLSGCYRINDNCIKILCQPRDPLSIQVLNLSGTNVTDDCLNYLSNLGCLKDLNLSKLKGLSDKGVLRLPALLPHLEALNISSLDRVSSDTCHKVKDSMMSTRVIF